MVPELAGVGQAPSRGEQRGCGFAPSDRLKTGLAAAPTVSHCIQLRREAGCAGLCFPYHPQITQNEATSSTGKAEDFIIRLR